jgi:hypothetical protein
LLFISSIRNPVPLFWCHQMCSEEREMAVTAVNYWECSRKSVTDCNVRMWWGLPCHETKFLTKRCWWY